MEEIKNETPENEPQNSSESVYTINEVFHITDDLLQFSKEKKYPIGAFIHGLVLTLELTQKIYNIPPQNLADVKRDCQHYADEFMSKNSEQKKSM